MHLLPTTRFNLYILHHLIFLLLHKFVTLPQYHQPDQSLQNSLWLIAPVAEISVGCRRKPTGFHKKAKRPIVKNGKNADRLLHKVMKYLLMNSTLPVFAIAQPQLYTLV